MVGGYYTNQGLRPGENQDSLCIQKAVLGKKQLVMAVICDGMGGLQSGEVASGNVIHAMCQWFLHNAQNILVYWDDKWIKEQWEDTLYLCDQRLAQYAKENSLKLGTTITGILMGEKTLIMHVGDSRAYGIGAQCRQLTIDHCLSQERRNVLLQCVGTGRGFQAQWIEEDEYDAYLLCTDGFYHYLDERCIARKLKHGEVKRQKKIARCLEELGRRVLHQGESDNLSAVYVCRED